MVIRVITDGRLAGTCKGQTEGGDADAILLVEDGGVVSNVVVGPNNGEGKSSAVFHSEVVT